MKRTRGFTLVELLVVIAIIAVLISVLLPAMAKARDAAKRIAGLSGLRQLATSIHLYANAYKGRVPLGYFYYPSFNSALNSGNKPMLMGLLISSGVMKDARPLYTPDVAEYPSQWFPINPTGTNTWSLLMDFNARPMVRWNEVAMEPPANLPRLGRELKRTAIVSDPFMWWGYLPEPANASWRRVRERYKTCVNVLYADGSALTIPLGTFDNPNPLGQHLRNADNSANNWAADLHWDALWKAFDRY